MQNVFHLFLIFLVQIFLLDCYPPSWIRELPTQPQSASDAELDGIFEKRLPPLSPLTSVYYKEKHSEILKFNAKEKSFQKIYIREIEDGGIFRRIRIEGSGKYRSKGNWVLLITENIDSEESVWKDGRQISSQKSSDLGSSSRKLLYHYDRGSDSVIPMIYDSGYGEKPFGVVDGTKNPHSEDDHFQISRRNYSRKEYQGHAYYKAK